LKDEYFHDNADKIIFELISNYATKYGAFPTKEALYIDLSGKPGDAKVFDRSKELINNLTSDPNTDLQFLVDQTEAFCKEKAVYNGIYKSIQIIDKKDKVESEGAIPQILTDALAVSFDTNIGHNWMDDSESRYDFYKLKEERVPFDIEYFNKITKGGVPNKTLNIILAGCVHPNTNVRIRYRKRVSDGI
jgi:hypothetical protein